MSRLRVAIQKSGRLSERSQELLKNCGLQFSRSKDKLFCFGENMPIDLLLVRDDDIPGLDAGLVGQPALPGLADQIERLRLRATSSLIERRDVLVAGLNQVRGVTCQSAPGAFYAFPNIQAFGLTSDQMANLILEKANVALLPGTSFGQYGEGYLRIVFANSLENIQRAVDRIGEALAGL